MRTIALFSRPRKAYAHGGTVPLLSGALLQQQTPTGGFSNASLNGGVVLSLTGRNSCGPDVIAGLLEADGVVLPTSDANPAIWLFEQGPGSTTPPTATLSSLTMSPATVVGGSQSSTGTVTLSGPAPSGGAQVIVSSSNSGVASVPSSATVPAGSTKASFSVNTSIVLFSKNVTISVSYNGTTKQANLAVNTVLGIL